MKKGYDVFGKAYGIMMRSDLHDPESIDHKLMQEMVLLDEESHDFLYRPAPELLDMKNHELYTFSRKFRGDSDSHTIRNILRYTAERAENFQDAFKTMQFGGTEKEILDRGTDWCADMARVGVVLLECNGIPARIIYLANLQKAYNGHVVAEAFYEGKYGVCDFIYGYSFYEEKPLDAYELMRRKRYLQAYPKDYAALYSAAAISDYNPMGDHNYKISLPNQYYLKLMSGNHNGKWMMGEEM